MPKQGSAGRVPLPRRHGDAETTPGRCANLDYCSIGMQRVLVSVPVNQPFVCPECGGRLRPPGAGRLGRTWIMPAAAVCLALLGLGLGLGLGYMIGHSQRAPKAVAIASPETVAKVNSARSALGLPQLPPEAIKPAPAEAAPGPATLAPLPPLVEQKPFPSHAPLLEKADPPRLLAGEQHFGQVTIDCTLGAVETKPTCRVSDVRGADAFSARALPWLQSLAVQYAPASDGGAPSLLDHRWRVIFADFAGSAAQPVPEKPAEAAATAAPAPAKHRHKRR